MIGEVIGADGDQVAPGTVGELVMTELFPFVQHQPLVRYRTGDVVRRMSESASELTFKYVRRIGDPDDVAHPETEGRHWPRAPAPSGETPR